MTVRMNIRILWNIVLLTIIFPPGSVPDDENEDSDHDYETVDDTLAVMMKKAQENVMYY